MTFPLTILAGRTAYRTLADKGWDPALFDTLVGASGGAKLLGLGHLDRFLFTDYLQRTDHPISLYGSSIGSWRHAALASADPGRTLAELQYRYLNQSWADDDRRGPTAIVDELCEWVMDGVLVEGNPESICEHPRFTSHIVTARGRGLNGARFKPVMGLGMGLSGAANALHRPWLSFGFQRVVFSSGETGGFTFRDFDTRHVPLSPDNVRDALLASGSIPLLMSGRRDVASAPPGHYWDGGIVDYHFDFANISTEGLVLYPHFTDHVIKGWFDKPWPWRRNNAALLDRVVIVAPSSDYVSALPHGKIPDRRDFPKMSQQERISFWQTCLDASEQLEAAFADVVDGENPLHHVTELA